MRVTSPNGMRMRLNTSIMEMAVRISGLSTGRYVTFIMAVRTDLRIPKMPMAASVPSTVASTEETTATTSVLYSAFMIEASWNRSAYQRRDTPANAVWLLELLKENTMSTRMGAYRNRNTNTIITRWNTLLIPKSPPSSPRPFRA